MGSVPLNCSKDGFAALVVRGEQVIGIGVGAGKSLADEPHLTPKVDSTRKASEVGCLLSHGGALRIERRIRVYRMRVIRKREKTYAETMRFGKALGLRGAIVNYAMQGR